MADTTYYRFVVKRDTAAHFTAANTLLLAGEFGLELDTKRKKTGDGTTPWNSLLYSDPGDIDLTGLVDGQVLVWSAALHKWMPGVSGGSGTLPPNVQTGTSYTLVVGDAGKDVQCSNAAPIALTIPKDVFVVGNWLLVSQTGSGVITIAGAAGVTFETATINATVAKGDVAGLEMVAANVWRFIGAGAAVLPDAPSDGTIYGRKNNLWAAVGAGATGQLAGLNDQTGTSYTVAATDAGKDIRCTNAAAVTLYIDKQAAVPVAANFWSLVSQGGAGIVTVKIVVGSGVLLRTPNGAATTAIYDARGIERITGDEWRVW